jgi:hypothetical protein
MFSVREGLGVRKIEVLMAVVVDGILVENALEFVLLERNMVAGASLYLPLDGLSVLEGTQSAMFRSSGV